MYKLFKLNLLVIWQKASHLLRIRISISTFSLNASAKDGMIPIEKLVCYGQGTGFNLSPSGDYVAAMVPVV